MLCFPWILEKLAMPSHISFLTWTFPQSRAQVIVNMPRDQEPVVTKEIGEIVKSLWQDPAIRQTFDRSSEYQLNDSTK